MGLGERCDEIVRLIDETLAACGADPADATPAVPTAAATVTPFPASAPRPERAASGF
jgi:hypothetical protein